MPSGHCNTGQLVAAGKAKSETSAAEHHRLCPAQFRGPIGITYCDCSCHGGADMSSATTEGSLITPLPPVELPTGKGSVQAMTYLMDRLRIEGVLDIIAPEGGTAVANAKQRVGAAARRHGFAVKATVANGLIHFTPFEGRKRRGGS